MTNQSLFKLGCAVGLTRAVEQVASAPVLLVLNYHRVGDPGECPYDPGTYSATADQFDAQIAYLKRRFRIVSLPEALELLDGGTRTPAILITFDDGYSDNYKVAFPILKSHGISGTFFLPTAFVGSDRLPWWDAIAYMIRNTKRPSIKLDYPAPLEVDARVFRRTLRMVLRLFKSPAMMDADRFFEQLSAATGIEAPARSAEPLFMDWAAVKDMAASGMEFGSHTHSHDLLARLTPERQLWELQHSRECIRRYGGIDVTTLAFPVGGRTTFSTETQAALAHSGYRGAFSFYGGVNVPKHTDRFDIRRAAVTMDFSLPVMRWRVSRMIGRAHWPAFTAARNPRSHPAQAAPL